MAVGGDWQATITEKQIIDRILETFDFDHQTHLLLDWLAYLTYSHDSTTRNSTLHHNILGYDGTLIATIM